MAEGIKLDLYALVGELYIRAIAAEKRVEDLQEVVALLEKPTPVATKEEPNGNE